MLSKQLKGHYSEQLIENNRSRGKLDGTVSSVIINIGDFMILIVIMITVILIIFVSVIHIVTVVSTSTIIIITAATEKKMHLKDIINTK